MGKMDIPPSKRNGRKPGPTPIARGPAKSLPPLDRAAEAVHRAVCELTGTDGVGHCAYYTVAGLALLQGLGVNSPDREGLRPQCGALSLLPDPDRRDRAFTMHCDGAAGLARGEFHSWVAVLSVRPPMLIDFSARHYRRLVERVVPIERVLSQGEDHALLVLADRDEIPAWRRDDPPSFIAIPEGSSHPWVHLRVDPAATTAFSAHWATHHDTYRPLYRTALEHYRRLTA
jgi:hypothetical protein